jgi:hypothetical protein
MAINEEIPHTICGVFFDGFIFRCSWTQGVRVIMQGDFGPPVNHGADKKYACLNTTSCPTV